jgi:Uma2 family endonuclease
MALVIEDAFLPATLTAPPMTDEEFAHFCAQHPDLFFEMTAEGELIVMPPTKTLTGARNLEILVQLGHWSRRDGRGIATDSSTGFVLPNGARRSPDAAWTSKAEIAKLSRQSREGFWHLCPAFAIELRSQSDRIRTLRAKMAEYIANGAQLAWLIDPETRAVEIYRPTREPEVIEKAESVTGEGPVEGFLLDLRPVWDPFMA